MTVIVIDGPEKAGKSTLVSLLRKNFGWGVVKWAGRAEPDDRIYLDPLLKAIVPRRNVHGHLVVQSKVVWDRSWASEHVYGTLLGQDRRLAADPWLGEWLYGRAASAAGLRLMLLGPDVETLERERNGSDLPVDPGDERELFRRYGERFGWAVVENRHDPGYALELARVVHHLALGLSDAALGVPPFYCGHPRPRVVFVGQDRETTFTVPGSGMPFTSRMTTEFGRRFGDAAIGAGWTNVSCVVPALLREGVTVVSVGKRAERWVETHVNPLGRHVSVAHPAYTRRWVKEDLPPKLLEEDILLDNLRVDFDVPTITL